jgi:hypothetical protein
MEVARPERTADWVKSQSFVKSAVDRDFASSTSRPAWS